MLQVRANTAWPAYGLALAVSLLTVAAAVGLAPWLGAGTWLLFAVPVGLSAWVGGFGPGALATLVGVLGLSYFLSKPIGNFSQLNLADVGPLAAAALVLAFLTTLVARSRQTALSARDQAARTAALTQAAWAFSNAASPQTVLETLARELAAALPVGLVVQSLSEDRESLHTAAVHHPEGELMAALRELYAAPQKTADSIGSGALADGQAALLTGVTAEQLRTGLKPRFWPSLERFAGSGLLLAPLQTQGEVLGLTTLLRPSKAGAFTEGEQAYTMALSERAAAALLLARRCQAETQQRQAAEATAEAARRLQGLATALAGARTADQVLGVQTELAREMGGVDSAEAADRGLLAQQCVLALEHFRLAEAAAAEQAEAARTTARLAELQAATAALSQALTLDEVLDQILGHGLSLARAEAGAVSLLRDGQAPLELVRSSGYPELALRSLRSLRLDQPAAEATAAASGQPVWLPSREACVTTFPQFAPAYASLRCEAVVVLPLAAEDQVLGTLTLAFDESQPITAEKAEALQAYATQCGRALRRAQAQAHERRARETAEAARERAAYLTEAGDLLFATLNLPAALQNITRLALREGLADFSLAFAIGHEGMALGAAHAHREPEREAALGGIIRLLLTLPGDKRTLIQDMLRAGKLLHVPDISHSMLATLPDENGLRRIVVDLDPEGAPRGAAVGRRPTAGRARAVRDRAGPLWTGSAVPGPGAGTARGAGSGTRTALRGGAVVEHGVGRQR